MIFLRRYKKYTSNIIYAQNDEPSLLAQSYFYICYIAISGIDIFKFDGYNKNDYNMRTACVDFTFRKNEWSHYSAVKNYKLCKTVRDYIGLHRELIRRIENHINNTKIEISYYHMSDTIRIDKLSLEGSMMYPSAKQHKTLMLTKSLMHI